MLQFLWLECGEQYAFVIPEDSVSITFLEDGVPLKAFFFFFFFFFFFPPGDAGCFHCIDACFVSGW
jgi:hypothetical protein